jgi:hypothetical protein
MHIYFSCNHAAATMTWIERERILKIHRHNKIRRYINGSYAQPNSNKYIDKKKKIVTSINTCYCIDLVKIFIIKST